MYTKVEKCSKSILLSSLKCNKSSKLKSIFWNPKDFFSRTFGYGDLTSDSFWVQSQAKTTQEIHKGERKIEHHLIIIFSVLDQISHWN